MIKIEKMVVQNIGRAVYSARNAMNSWDRSDSHGDVLGENDLKLAKTLAKAGTSDRKYLRMVTVLVDITAPLYWWKEFDTYKVGTVANSCSTMHKIHAKEFTLDDFSHEHLLFLARENLENTIRTLNRYRNEYNDVTRGAKNKDYWWQIIQLLPSSFNQKRTVMMNYEVLANMYHSRKNHKLDEWRDLCKWVKSLPYSVLITGEEQWNGEY